MGNFQSLNDYLADWAGSDARRRAVAETVLALAAAGARISGLIARGPLAGSMADVIGVHDSGGDTQKKLDVITNDLVMEALKASPVAMMGSEESDQPLPIKPGAPLVVNVDPLDGSSNIDTNVSIGTIFSILPNEGPEPLLQPGVRQLAAGYIIYGPQTALVLTLGSGTHIFWMDPDTKTYLLARRDVKIPADTREYAINSSNMRHWDAAMKHYIVDCKMGVDGPRKADFNMRWVGSLVADAFRILARGGIYLYPGDARKGYTEGRLRLLYEAAPIAMIVEEAGGACSTGLVRIMDIQPKTLHQRVPLIFGSRNEVGEVEHYYRQPHSIGEHSPLFGQRGLFRT